MPQLISFRFEIKGFSSAVSSKIVPRVVRVPEVFLDRVHSWVFSRLARDVMWLKPDQGSKIIRPCHRRESCPSHDLGKDEKWLNCFFFLHCYHLRTKWGQRHKQRRRWKGKRGKFILDPAVITLVDCYTSVAQVV